MGIGIYTSLSPMLSALALALALALAVAFDLLLIWFLICRDIRRLSGALM